MAARVILVTPRLVERFWQKVKRGPECWLWTAATAEGRYGILQIKLDDGRFVAELAHRVSWVIANGQQIPEGRFVCHTCDRMQCVRPTHLWLGDATSNMADRDAKGRQAAGDRNGSRLHPESRPRGANHYETTLTDDDVRQIRIARAAGEPLPLLATRYDVTKQAIWRIVHRRTWKHVD